MLLEELNYVLLVGLMDAGEVQNNFGVQVQQLLLPNASTQNLILR